MKFCCMVIIKIRESLKNLVQKNTTINVINLFGKKVSYTHFPKYHHSILLAILTRFNFSPLALKWFSSHIRGRQQPAAVCLGSMSSDWADSEAGVPQGGILSLLLFFLFIDSITPIFTCSYHMYTDDLQLYA